MTVWSGVRPAPGSCDRCVVGRLPGAGDQDPAGQGDRAAEVWRHSGRCMATNGAARDGDEVCLVWNPPRRMKKKQEDRPWYVVKQDSYPSLREIQVAIPLSNLLSTCFCDRSSWRRSGVPTARSSEIGLGSCHVVSNPGELHPPTDALLRCGARCAEYIGSYLA
eukprot:TRINITY_DN644_c0_g1_i18.p1 TRINITY_DN644_c0_g1~~TRINITY_DN644_c0_g1_i18.p1  ORF type:complete len:164 (-),score=4.70 TRINITY_DN644_c0_g1_i18:112-603(-)